MISNEFTDKIWIYFQSNLTEKTMSEYWKIMRDYDRIVGKDLLSLTNKDAKKYYDSLIERINSGKLQYSTASMRLSVVRSVSEFICKYDERHGIKYENFFKEFSLPEPDKTLKQEDIPTLKEIDNIYRIIKANHDTTALLIVSLGIKCGLTSKEISMIKRTHVFEESKNNLCLRIEDSTRANAKSTRSNTVRIIKLPKDVSKVMDTFLSSDDKLYDTNQSYIFINRHGTNMKVRDIERLIKKYMDIALEKRKISKTFTMQDLRHAAFAYMLIGGAGKEKVAYYGGISTKWMSRYDKLVSSATIDQAIEYSIINIDTNKLLR
ncbi:MAG: tyrosine-type recombinase/integrase [Lachnospira sp.]